MLVAGEDANPAGLLDERHPEPFLCLYGELMPDSTPALAAVSAALCVDIVPAERMLKLFAYEHLRADLQLVSAPFAALAHLIAERIPAGPERTVALRKLLEAKDAAVRAVAIPK